MEKKIYFDYAATTPTDPEVVEEMLPYFSEIFGNPSSIHHYFGQQTNRAIEKARENIADFLGASPDEIVFTSGGTESNNFALKGVAYANRSKGNHIIISSIEHSSIIEPARFLEKQGFKITRLTVDKNGIVNPSDFEKAITDKTILLSVMHANSEIGTIQPIKELAGMARENDVCFHTDAVQAFGHLPLSVSKLNVDLLSVSAHKLYGPKGIGALYIRKGTKVSPLMHGGDQEKRRRASIENLPGIAGFAKAVELAKGRMRDEAKYLTVLRDKLIKGILDKIDHVRINGHLKKRLPNNVNVSIEYIEGEAMALTLDMEGIACSTGSACSSSDLKPSHVLLGLGLTEEMAHGSLRFTMGRYTKEEDVDYLIGVLPGVVNQLRAMSPLYKGN